MACSATSISFGEITRGMLVVDRRIDESAYTPGANRAEVQSELDNATLSHGGESIAILPAAPVQVQGAGVFCITGTPGPNTLLCLLLQRVWGINHT